ncbi:phage tail tube protein [Frankia sp. AgW1.1]|uniref:phage tail tube protein n=1 Tax=Frankia sp. AgW1.1 TaxID=1836971 RepID=UPI0019349622|nr:phage tail tube protein [Frankia sp. AgW1.1]MBL7487079.1 hypothetical protein [Frankia sp. AgW1.1]
MTAAPAQATNLSYLGVALDAHRAVLTANASASATTLTVNDTTSWSGTGFVTIYDTTSGGTATETIAYSAASGGSITCSATANAHTAGCLVVQTASAAAPTAYIPVKTFEPFDNLTLLDDTGYRGSEVGIFGSVAGVIHSEYSTSGDVFPESIGYFLGAMLGDYAVTGGSAPYSHVFNIKNNAGNYGGGQPESLTVVDYSALTGATSNKARAYPGSVVSELTITWSSEALLTWSAKLTGWPSGVIAKPTSSWTGVSAPTPAWSGVTSIGGSPKLYVASGELQLKRDVKVLHTVDGVQGPYGIWLGPLAVTGKMTFIAADETELLRYLNATNPSLSVNFETGTGGSLVGLDIALQTVSYRNTKTMRGQTYTTIETDFTALGNTTNVGSSGGYGLCTITAKNSISSSTYQ